MRSPWTHDPRGLANLYGGRAAFEAKLDAVFAADPQYLPGSYVDVIHEMREAFDTGMGQYAHGNEPMHSTIYMYDYAGAPWKAQQRAREVLDKLYGPGLGDGDGYLGDEDNGQMSAWYIFSALGFYPAAAGHAQYAIGSPLFSRATLHLEGGSDLTIVARDNGPENRYIQRARLNGVDLDRPYLDHAEVAAGGLLEFDMGPKPSNWGTHPATAPSSATATDHVPVALEDCAEGGSASASSENPNHVAQQAFDDDSATKWLTDEKRGHLRYHFANGQKRSVRLYTITSADDVPGRDPMDWTLSGSHDGRSWVAIDTQSGLAFAWRRQTRVFAAANTTGYEFYRLTIDRNHGAPMTQLAELELFEDEMGVESADTPPVDPRTSTVDDGDSGQSDVKDTAEGAATNSCLDAGSQGSGRSPQSCSVLDAGKQGSGTSPSSSALDAGIRIDLTSAGAGCSACGSDAAKPKIRPTLGCAVSEVGRGRWAVFATLPLLCGRRQRRTTRASAAVAESDASRTRRRRPARHVCMYRELGQPWEAGPHPDAARDFDL